MTDHALYQAQARLAAGDRDGACQMATARETRNIHHPDAHLAWADLLTELEMFDDLLTELNLAARDAPGSLEIQIRLAEAYQDNGRLKQAADSWRQAIDLAPDRADSYLSLGRLLESAGKLEAAAEVYQAGQARTGQAMFKNLLREITPPEPEPPAPDTPDLTPTDTDLVRFCHLFEGREGVYARQWTGASGKSGYTPVREPFTPAVARGHLLGQHTIGIYPLRLDNTVRFLAFDVDVPSFEAARVTADRQAWAGLMQRAQGLAETIVNIGAELGLAFHLEDSGFKGRHCWLFFREPVPGLAARRLAQMLLDRLDPTTPGLHIETFPKQAALKGDGLGNLIKLPLGFHRVSGRRSLFLDRTGRAWPDQLAALRAIQTVEREQVLALIQHAPARPVQLTPAQTSGQEPESTDSRPALPGPAAIEVYDPERDPELQYLLLKCEVIRTIVEQINRTGQIDHEATIVLAHTVGHLGHGPEAFNSLVRRASQVDPGQFLQSRLKGNPISCPKIRQRLHRITSTLACDCQFGPDLYPSPVRHVQTMSRSDVTGVTLDSMRFEHLLREYMKVRRQTAEMLQLLSDYERRLADVFEQSGAESIQTAQGTLRMIAGPDGRPGFSLSI